MTETPEVQAAEAGPEGPAATAVLNIHQFAENQNIGYTLEFDCMRTGGGIRLGPADIAAMALAGCMMDPETTYSDQVFRMNQAVARLSAALDEAGDDIEAGKAATRRFAEETGLPFNVEA